MNPLVFGRIHRYPKRVIRFFSASKSFKSTGNATWSNGVTATLTPPDCQSAARSNNTKTCVWPPMPSATRKNADFGNRSINSRPTTSKGFVLTVPPLAQAVAKIVGCQRDVEDAFKLDSSVCADERDPPACDPSFVGHRERFEAEPNVALVSRCLCPTRADLFPSLKGCSRGPH